MWALRGASFDASMASLPRSASNPLWSALRRDLELAAKGIDGVGTGRLSHLPADCEGEPREMPHGAIPAHSAYMP